METRRLSTNMTRVVARGDAEVRLMQTCTVEVLAGPGTGITARIEKPSFSIGTHETNDLVLTDDSVSKHHLEVSVVPDGWRIVDLSSSNGTFLGGIKVTDITVIEPVQLQIGTTSLRITPAMGEKEVPAS